MRTRIRISQAGRPADSAVHPMRRPPFDIYSAIMLANYHTHTSFCDGTASVRDMAQAAFLAGYKILGFSAHAPVPLPSPGNLAPERVAPYVRAVRESAEEFSGRMEILAGLELEWVPGIGIPPADGYASVPLDYSIGSVHYVKSPSGKFFTVDCPEDEFDRAMRGGYGGNGSRFYRDYWGEMIGLIRSGGFDILGHLDIVKKNNQGARWFDEFSPDYLRTAFEAVEALAETGMVVEINTGGMARGKLLEPYPSLPILKEMKRRRVSVCIGADAHALAHLDKEWRDIGVEWAREAGYRELLVFSHGEWRAGPLE